MEEKTKSLKYDKKPEQMEELKYHIFHQCFMGDGVPAIDLVCAATTAIVDPDSRCSRVSPTQAITFKPWVSAYATLSPTNCIYTNEDNILINNKKPKQKDDVK